MDALYQHIFGNCQHYNTNRPGPHLSDCGICGCRLLPFERTPDHWRDADICSETVSRLQSGRNDSGMSEIPGEMDFRGKTSLAEMKLLSPQGTMGTFSGGFSVDSSMTIGSWLGKLVETEDVICKSTHPKNPSSISSRDVVSVPARATLIFPNPS